MAAFVAWKYGPVPSVKKHVLANIEIAGKSLVAYVAFVWLLARVSPCVSLKRADRGESLRADLAFEGSLAGVTPEMKLQLARGNELHFAFGAAVMLFHRMFALNVLHKSLVGSKALAAKFTHMPHFHNTT